MFAFSQIPVSSSGEVAGKFPDFSEDLRLRRFVCHKFKAPPDKFKARLTSSKLRSPGPFFQILVLQADRTRTRISVIQAPEEAAPAEAEDRAPENSSNLEA